MADTEGAEPAFEGLIRFIQEHRGVDFRGYKRASLRRRVARRMEEAGAEGFAAYHALLEADPQEIAALLRSEEHTSELQSRHYLVCRLLLEKTQQNYNGATIVNLFFRVT